METGWKRCHRGTGAGTKVLAVRVGQGGPGGPALPWPLSGNHLPGEADNQTDFAQ